MDLIGAIGAKEKYQMVRLGIFTMKENHLAMELLQLYLLG